eukprot:TRINITY_DN105502_c0_g1_i1.p1 TRINITY_DN105502_c0_g1~~TRINITY_DN105502_c0_g1_i1.p1  ORF type:complete len:243 (-),score=30.51 TRINITY_DN105502_c0_g1_i1:241-969(-)
MCGTLLLDTPTFGKCSIAGCWQALPGQPSLHFMDYALKDEIGVTSLLGLPAWHGADKLLAGHSFIIDPYISSLKFYSNPGCEAEEFPLDGTEHSYIGILVVGGAVSFKCTSRSYTCISATSGLPNGLGRLDWHVQLDADGDHLTVQCMSSQTGVLSQIMYRRMDISEQRACRGASNCVASIRCPSFYSSSMDRQKRERRWAPKVTAVSEERRHTLVRSHGCMPFLRRRRVSEESANDCEKSQ